MTLEGICGASTADIHRDHRKPPICCDCYGFHSVLWDVESVLNQAREGVSGDTLEGVRHVAHGDGGVPSGGVCNVKQSRDVGEDWPCFNSRPDLSDKSNLERASNTQRTVST